MMLIQLPGLLLGLLLPSVGDLGQERENNKPDLTRAKEYILEATNKLRTEEKHNKLKVNSELSQSAQKFADFMAQSDKYGHEADGRKVAERVVDAGYEYCLVAENIAYLYSSEGFATSDLADQFMKGWRNSRNHLRNLLDADMMDIGIGIAQSANSGKYYAVQNFGRPKSSAIVFQITNSTAQMIKYKLGDEELSIEPSFTITHRQSRPPLLQFIVPGKNEDKLRPDNGSHYTVRTDDNGNLRIDKK